MLKKIIIIVIATATAVWVFAEPGTWGKETPTAEKEAKAPAVQFNRWLKDFRAAYELRDGEKMGLLIKAIEDKQKDMPDMPRVEKWLTNVKETYESQDVQKMGRLLDNAGQMRDRVRERFQQNRDGQQGRGDGNFGERGRRIDAPRGRGADAFADRGSGPADFNRQRGNDRQRDDFGPGNNDRRPEEFRSRGEMPANGEFEGPRPMRRFEPQRPMRPEFGPEGFAPRFAPRDSARFDRMDLRPYSRADQPGFAPRFQDNGRMERPEWNSRPMIRGEFGRRGFAPEQSGRDQQRSFEPRMRRDLPRQFDGQDARGDEPSQNRTVPDNFWR
jgi:hypothetical protein